MNNAPELADGTEAGQVPHVEESLSRARLYRFLARLYRVEADQALLDELRALPQVQAAPDDDLMGVGMNAVVGYAKVGGGDALTELAVDYVRTFIGSGTDGHEAAYPFESVYLSEKHLMMQAARDEVRAIYLSEGLDRKPTARTTWSAASVRGPSGPSTSAPASVTAVRRQPVSICTPASASRSRSMESFISGTGIPAERRSGRASTRVTSLPSCA